MIWHAGVGLFPSGIYVQPSLIYISPYGELPAQCLQCPWCSEPFCFANIFWLAIDRYDRRREEDCTY